MNSSLVLQEHPHSGYSDRTEVNAKSADLTIAFAVDFTTAGERLTSRVAGRNYIAIPLEYDDDRAARHICKAMFERNAKSLNIAGNGIYTLSKKAITQEDVNEQIYNILKKVNEKNPIKHIRSGGQTGVDMAGLVAGVCLNIPVTGLFPKGFRQRNEQGVDECHYEHYLVRLILKYVYALTPERIQVEGFVS